MQQQVHGRLDRAEINLLKHLVRVSSCGSPVSVPAQFRPAFVPLWRRGLIEIWYRQDRDSAGGRRSQFVSLTLDGSRRADAILNGNRFRRLAESQGQEQSSDQPSQPQQVR